MDCPRCGEEMVKKEEASPNYFLIFTTRTHYYEYYRCRNCGYETEKELLRVKSLMGFSDYDKDKDDK